jgi:hypothetical protein
MTTQNKPQITQMTQISRCHAEATDAGREAPCSSICVIGVNLRFDFRRTREARRDVRDQFWKSRNPGILVSLSFP